MLPDPYMLVVFVNFTICTIVVWLVADHKKVVGCGKNIELKEEIITDLLKSIRFFQLYQV